MAGAGERGVVAELAIDLVADQRDVVLGGELGQAADFLFAGDDAGGVRGAVEQDHLRARRDRGRDLVEVDPKIGIRVDQHRLAADHPHERRVHHEVRIEHDHFVAGLTIASIASTSAPLVPRGDQHAAIGVVVFVVHAACSVRAQLGNALRLAVAVFVGVNGVAMAASLMASGTGKSGWPIERLIGFFILAARSNTLRMPELSNCAVRSASQGWDMGDAGG